MLVRGLGGTDDSPGESGAVYAAFAGFMDHGGCSYTEFTPEACAAATEAWTAGYNSGKIKLNPSFQDTSLMYSLFGGAPPTTRRGSPEAAAMVAAAAAALGVSQTAYIRPILASAFIAQTPAQITPQTLAILPPSVRALIEGPPALPPEAQPIVPPVTASPSPAPVSSAPPPIVSVPPVAFFSALAAFPRWLLVAGALGLGAVLLFANEE